MGTKRIVVTARAYGAIPEAMAIFNESGHEIVTDFSGALTERELLDMIRDAHAVVVGMERITAEVLDEAPHLLAIGRPGVGINTIDLNAATRHGVVVTYAPGALDNAVSEMAIALCFALVRRLIECHHSVSRGEWNKVVGWEVAGKTLGIVGFGSIGKEVAVRANALGMKVLAYDVAPDASFAESHGVELVTLDELLSCSDIVSLHVPLTRGTYRLIGERELSLMKQGAFLVNLSRGGVVDEQALYERLKSRKLAGAAIDVFEHEPPSGSPLLTLDNVVLSPHVGGSTFESLGEVLKITARNVVAVLAGKRVDARFVANPDVYQEMQSNSGH